LFVGCRAAAICKILLIKIDKTSEARQWLIDSGAHFAGGWANGAEVWATVFCCPHVREAICTVCPRSGGELVFRVSVILSMATSLRRGPIEIKIF
jgi:hypothetical protein